MNNGEKKNKNGGKEDETNKWRNNGVKYNDKILMEEGWSKGKMEDLYK